MSSPGYPSLAISRDWPAQALVLALAAGIMLVVPIQLASVLGRVTWLAALVGTCGLLISMRWIGWLGGARAVHQARCDAEGHWRLSNGGAHEWSADLQAGVQFGGLIWLRFGGAAGCRELLLRTRELSSRTRRHLAVRLAMRPSRREVDLSIPAREAG